MKIRNGIFIFCFILLRITLVEPVFAAVSPISVTDGSSQTIPEGESINNTDSGASAILVSRGAVDGGTLTIDSAGRGIYAYLYYNYQSPTMDGIVDLGRVTVNTTSPTAIAVEADTYNYIHKAEVHLGSGSVINSEATALLSNRNALITIGDGATITGKTYGTTVAVVSARTSGRIEIGDKAVIGQVNNDDTPYSQNHIAVMAYNAPSSIFAGEGYIKIGDESKIYSLGAGQGSSAVVTGYVFDPISTSTALYSGNIEIGKSADISTVGTQSYAVWGRHSDSTIVIGEGSRITTSGNGSSAVRAGFGSSGAGGTITLGQNTEVITTGDSAHGIDSSYSGSLISAGQGAMITTNGAGSHAVYAYNAGQVSMGQGAMITTNGAGSHAVYAYGAGRVSMNGATLSADSNQGSFAVMAQGQLLSRAQITGTGVYDITGGIRAANYSTIDFDWGDGSVFTGYTERGNVFATLNLGISGANSVWNITGNSSLNGLTLDGSTVDYTRSALGTTLTAVSLNAGNPGTGGNFVMKTDIAVGTGDLLVISGTSDGSHKIHVNDQGSAPTTGTETLTIVETSDGAANFSLTRGYTYAGAWEYALRPVSGTAGHWELYATGGAAPVASAAVNTFSAAYLMAYAETQTLIQRLGDLRDTPHLSGAWFRLHGGKFESNSGSFVKPYDMDYWGVQLGYDRKIEIKAAGDLYAGIMFGWSTGDLDYLSVGDGKVDSKTLGVYGTYIMPNGFFADLVLKYQWMDNDFRVLDSSSGPVIGDDVTTGGFGASLEIGRRMRIGGEKGSAAGWYAEPQAQISWQRQDGGYFLTGDGLHIGVDSFTSLLGRLGMLIGYETENMNIYAKVSRVKEFDGDVDIYANGVRIGESFGGDWWVYGLGFTTRVNDRNSVYLDIERSSGGSFTQKWAVKGGWRVSF